MLAAYGLHITQERLATNTQNAASSARDIGKPVALKIESPDIPHKTEANAIRLNVTGDAEVARAFDEVMAAARGYKPEARLDGVLVQEMAPGGVEVMLGVASDPTFGVVVVAALGGIHVEILRDVAYRIPPLHVTDAHSMLRELRAYPIFGGVRGARRAISTRYATLSSAFMAGVRSRRYHSRNRHQSLDRARGRRGRAGRRRAHHPKQEPTHDHRASRTALTHQDGVMWLTFNRPNKANALSLPVLAGLQPGAKRSRHAR